MALPPARRLKQAQSRPPDESMALFCLPLAIQGQGQLQPALRRETGQREAVQRFLKWILGETSPTIYVSFQKKKRENLRGPGDRAGPDFCMQWPNRSMRLFSPVAAANGSGR